jgi:hypothetical protein
MMETLVVEMSPRASGYGGAVGRCASAGREAGESVEEWSKGGDDIDIDIKIDNVCESQAYAAIIDYRVVVCPDIRHVGVKVKTTFKRAPPLPQTRCNPGDEKKQT